MPGVASGVRSPRRRVGIVLVSIVAGCADFSSEASTFTVQPSLTAPAAQPVDPSYRAAVVTVALVQRPVAQPRPERQPGTQRSVRTDG